MALVDNFLGNQHGTSRLMMMQVRLHEAEHLLLHSAPFCLPAKESSLFSAPSVCIARRRGAAAAARIPGAVDVTSGQEQHASSPCLFENFFGPMFIKRLSIPGFRSMGRIEHIFRFFCYWNRVCRHCKRASPIASAFLLNESRTQVTGKSNT